MKNIRKLVLCLFILLMLTACGGKGSVSLNDTILDKDYAKITLKDYTYEIISDAKKDDGKNSSAEEKYGLIDKKDIYNLWGYFNFEIENKTDEDIEFIIWPYSYFYNSDYKDKSIMGMMDTSGINRSRAQGNHSLNDYSPYVVLVPAKSTETFSVEKVESGLNKDKKDMKIKDFKWIGCQIGLNGTIIGEVFLDYENNNVEEDLLDVVYEPNEVPQEDVVPQQENTDNTPVEQTPIEDIAPDDYESMVEYVANQYLNVEWCDCGTCRPSIEHNEGNEVYLYLNAGGAPFEFLVYKDNPTDVYYYPISTGEWTLIWSNGQKLFNELPQ